MKTKTRMARPSPRQALILAVSILTMVLLACNLTGPSATQPRPELETSAGTMVIAEVALADRFPPGCSSGPTCKRAQEGHQILIVWLERPDGGSIGEVSGKLFGETLSLLNDDSEAYVTASDGSQAGLAIAHVSDDDDRFALVFVPPDSAHGFQLTWPDNPTIDLGE